MSDALPKRTVLRGTLTIGIILLGLMSGAPRAWSQLALPQDAVDQGRQGDRGGVGVD
jgi:hypothetical protein